MVSLPHMETTTANKQSVVGALTIAKTYRILGVVFFVLSIVSFVPALLFFYNGFMGKAVFLVGYALLNLLFGYGLWKRERWMVALSLINLSGIFLAKGFGFLKGTTTGLNFLITVLLVAILAGFIYATRSSLKGKRSEDMTILVAYLIVLVPILLRSVGVL